MITEAAMILDEREFYYWEYYARQVAFDNKEYCLCWDTSPPSLKISQVKSYNPNDPKSSKVKISIKCNRKNFTCNTDFSKTQAQLEQMFKDFYKGQ